VLDALSGIGSDYDCREVLVALAKVMPKDADLIARYRGVAQHLSDYERGEAERALIGPRADALLKGRRADARRFVESALSSVTSCNG
jgi:hypothetical protein